MRLTVPGPGSLLKNLGGAVRVGTFNSAPRRYLGRQPAQLVVDQRQELLGGVRIALLDGGQDAGDFVHGQHHWTRESRGKIVVVTFVRRGESFLPLRVLSVELPGRFPSAGIRR